MLSDNERMKVRPSKPSRAIEKSGRTWSDKQRREAAQLYLSLGNMSLVSNFTGIPYITLKVWKRTEWWNDLIQEIRTQDKIELSARLKKIVAASLTVVEDRLEHGDFQFDQKTGQNVRKPVNLKDAHKVAVDLQTRQEVLEKLDKPEVTDEAVESKLLKLAEKFSAMATMKINQKLNVPLVEEVEDATIVQETSR
jgi:hypothetical protein